MGKAAKWFRGILGMKKEKERVDGVEISNLTAINNGRIHVRTEKRRWSFAKVGKDEIALDDGFNDCSWRGEEQSRHAIAVAAATAAAADAAVAAAEAAVAVVRLTSGGHRGALFWGKWEVLGAVRIQSVFRGYLARKALRALKGLVKLQALVRGFLVRKRASAALASMEALVRAQLAVKLHRSRRSLDKENRFQPRKSIEKRWDDSKTEFHSKRISTSYETIHSLFSESPKIVEVDTCKPKSRSRRVNDFVDQLNSSPLPFHVPSSISIPDKRFQDFDWSFVGDEVKFSTAHNTPRFRSSGRTSLNSPATPAKSACGEGYFRDYGNSPNYMLSTKSYTAKLRSNSAPKQRPEAAPRKMTSLSDIMAARKSVSAVRMHRTVPENGEF